MCPFPTLGPWPLPPQCRATPPGGSEKPGGHLRLPPSLPAPPFSQRLDATPRTAAQAHAPVFEHRILWKKMSPGRDLNPRGPHEDEPRVGGRPDWLEPAPLA
ncbi:hypothetical protein JTE90_002919 [Oedothorax gibbosus]|uniref:Uncharacterized protein n=1 Tax=Oedothorax gibbosus TaxID=931172 RepID=A0AAV6TM99_9ARAC|nr:hypothetical protein JTE90_002919 [Oedothorax gibbosus]